MVYTCSKCRHKLVEYITGMRVLTIKICTNNKCRLKYSIIGEEVDTEVLTSSLHKFYLDYIGKH